MNILPKKRWHVRTKDNIARVRRDEAKAAEEEKERERRAKLAEQESRTALLRRRARGTDEETSGIPKINFIGPGDNEDRSAENKISQENSDDSSKKQNLDAFSCEINKPCADIFTESGNINFFKDLETGVSSTNSLTNKEHESEERAEKEKYEKQIGLLTYLGQDSLEATKSKEWYHDSSRCISSLWSVKDSKDSDTINDDAAENGTENIKVGLKYKAAHDPLNDMIKYAGWKRTKSSCIVGEAAATESSQIYSVESNNRSLSPPSPKKERKLKKLLKERQKLDKKILGYSRSKEKGSKKRKKTSSDSSDDSHEGRKRKRVERDDEVRSKKRKKSHHSSKKKKIKHSKSAKKKKNSFKSPSQSDNSSSDSSSQSDFTTDSEAEREELEQQRQKLAKLREARLAREAVERQREKRLLAGQKPDEVPPPAGGEVVKQKYSSQFNPLLARQNRGLQSGAKYF